MEHEEIDWNTMEEHATTGEGASEDDGIPVIALSEDMIMRRLLWDTVPCSLASEVARYLELPATSDEVESMEHTQSHARLLMASNLAQTVATLALAASKTIVGAMIVGGGEKEDIPLKGEFHTEALLKFQPVVFQASMAVVAELVDLGLIHTPHFLMIDVELPEDEGE